MSIIIAGYITVPQLRYIDGQKPVCDMQFTFTQKDKGNSVSTRQIRLTAWNGLAEAAAQTYGKGGYAIVYANYHNDVVESAAGKSYYHSLSAIRLMPGQEGLDLNVAFLVGAVGADSAIKYFDSGACKATNRLAVRRTNDITDWIGLEAWGKEAETMVNYVPKGKQIAVEGRFQMDSWQDKATGDERSRPFVLVERLTLLGGKPAGDALAPTAVNAQASSPSSYDDMPF